MFILQKTFDLKKVIHTEWIILSVPKVTANLYCICFTFLNLSNFNDRLFWSSFSEIIWTLKAVVLSSRWSPCLFCSCLLPELTLKTVMRRFRPFKALPVPVKPQCLWLDNVKNVVNRVILSSLVKNRDLNWFETSLLFIYTVLWNSGTVDNKGLELNGSNSCDKNKYL